MMPDRVVALQLLLSYWLAVILPPVLCFSSIYNDHTSAFSNFSPQSYQRGYKFGGYKIIPKPCNDTSTPEKEAGVCMFNYECTRSSGTVVGSCMDGFLYGACCKLHRGVSLATINLPQITSTRQPTSAASDRFTTLLRPHISHSPEETYLLFNNGTAVQNPNSPEDFLVLSKHQMQLVPHSSPIAFKPTINTPNVASSTDWPTTTRELLTPSTSWHSSPAFVNSEEPMVPSISLHDRPVVNQHTSPTSLTSRVPFSPDFSSTKFNTNPSILHTPSNYFSQSSKINIISHSYMPTMAPVPTLTNKNELYDRDENMIRVPTINASGPLKYTTNTSISHILSLLNDTNTEPDAEAPVTQQTQSFYTWLSIQNNIDEGSGSSYSSTKPVHHTIYKPSTTMPSTTIHHIPGPSFHVTPEVKITPKPQNAVSEPVPTVIVLSSAQDTTSLPQKKPTHSYSASSAYNSSYHYPLLIASSTNKPYIKPMYSTTSLDEPLYSSVLITAKPSQSSYSTSKPSAAFLTKPLIAAESVYSSSTTSKPVKTAAPYTKIKPANILGQTTVPSSFVHSSTIVTTAKPILSGNVNSNTTIQPLFGASQTVPIYTNFPQPPFVVSTFGTSISNSSQQNIFDFPPVRDPNVNLTAIQQLQRPVITSTTTFGDDESEENEVAPAFVVDKTLEDKMHVFVEKIVQSLQGNFEDLEKVLIAGDSTSNVTVNTGPQNKPSTVNKKPTTKPTSTRPQKVTATIITSSVTKKPVKKPPVVSSVLLFQPSSTTQTIISILNNRPPVKVTTAISISPGSPTTSATNVENVNENGEVSDTTSNVEVVSDDSEHDYKTTCGVRPLARKKSRIVGGKGTTFGEWPWQVLVREATWLGLFTKNKCGGVLITDKYVITAAHCQPGFLANLVAVFGDFDITGEVESKRSMSKNVKRVIVHRQYNAATFENDIALLELESPVQFDVHIVPICMPGDTEEFIGRMATVTGWGRLKYGGGVPTILQEVQVPVLENNVCQEMFNTAGHPKVILPSFICAGYANGQRDSCEGDSGGPLMVERPDGRWTLVATVSHGIKCAAPYLPGVYMRTTYYKPWLQTITGVQ